MSVGNEEMIVNSKTGRQASLKVDSFSVKWLGRAGLKEQWTDGYSALDEGLYDF